MKERRVIFWANDPHSAGKIKVTGIVCDKYMWKYNTSNGTDISVDYYLIKEILSDGLQKIHHVLPVNIIEIN